MSFTMPDTLITTYLEMTHPSEFKPAFLNLPNVRVEKIQNIDLSFYLQLYTAVGEKYRWRDRLVMTKAELQGALERAHIYVMYVDNTPAGYIELLPTGASIEIVYFGLREEFHGQGLGKHLLSCGIIQAWKMGAERVWVHTCNLDGVQAISNYLKRGFHVFREHREPMPQAYL